MVLILKSGHPGYALAGGNGRSSNGEGGAGGMLFRLPAPGNPILDKFGEGKPHNQLNALTFITGRVIQTLDMNQQGYWESNLLLPNALSLLLPLHASPTISLAATTTSSASAITTLSPLAIASGTAPSSSTTTSTATAAAAAAAAAVASTSPTPAKRPLVCVGLREHIFTHTLSAPAYFMAQQELLFGTMWQRIMASPLHVRLHYGHPDLLSAVWVGNRGGCAKASSVVNVSEDIFAGYSIALRGGESGHVEFLSVGKGRDVGLLQIEVFESKISGGTAISGTTRDAYRFLSALDFPRLLSAFHTGIGFYISNVLVLFSLVLTLYYMAAITLSGLATAVQRSNFVYLLGEITLLQWVLQLGVLSVVPLAVLYVLEHGVVKGLRKTLHLFTGLSPIFFMFEIGTKAVFFDAALAFGSQGYLATGRDFVIKHVPFPEIFAASAHSHMYLGGETLVLLLSITVTGSFELTSTYVFFFLAGWLFTFSLLGAPLFFNPGACEWRHLKADWRAWVAWMWDGPGGGTGMGVGVGDTGSSWRAWHRVVGEGPYATASAVTRAWRALRVSRLAFLAALIIGRLSGKNTLTYLVYHLALPFGTLAGLQVATMLVNATHHSLLPPAPHTHTPVHPSSRSSTTNTTTPAPPPPPPTSTPHPSSSVHAPPPACLPYFSLALTLTTLTATTFTLLILLPSLGAYVLASLSDLLWVTVAHFLLHAWASRLVLILNFKPLYNGSITLWRALDAVFGTLILATQAALSLAIPFASLCHTRVMYSRSYSEVVEVINGSRDALSAGGGVGGGGGVLGGITIDPTPSTAAAAAAAAAAHGNSTTLPVRGKGEDGMGGFLAPGFHNGKRKWRNRRLVGSSLVAHTTRSYTASASTSATNAGGAPPPPTRSNPFSSAMSGGGLGVGGVGGGFGGLGALAAFGAAAITSTKAVGAPSGGGGVGEGGVNLQPPPDSFSSLPSLPSPPSANASAAPRKTLKEVLLGGNNVRKAILSSTTATTTTTTSSTTAAKATLNPVGGAKGGPSRFGGRVGEGGGGGSSSNSSTTLPPSSFAPNSSAFQALRAKFNLKK